MAVELYDEHEQSERVRKWLRENGTSIALGVVLALSGLFGWRQWQDYRAEQAVLANEYYAAISQELQAGNVAGAAEQLEAMREGVGEHSYTTLAAMRVASDLAGGNEVERAAGIYRSLLDSASDALKPLIRLRLALLEAAQGQGEQALARLQGEPPVGYEGLWLETRGDVLFDLGRLREAGDAYAAAVDRLRSQGRSFRQAELKLDSVKSSAGAAGAS
jgi:predicted negative regulator of RcsB-dependent stress response